MNPMLLRNEIPINLYGTQEYLYPVFNCKMWLDAHEELFSVASLEYWLHVKVGSSA